MAKNVTTALAAKQFLTRRLWPTAMLSTMAALIGGCRTLPLHQHTGPATTFSSRLQFGTPLSGPQESTRDIAGSPGFIVRAEFWKLYYMPVVKLPPLAGQSTLLINNAASQPTMAFPRLSARARFGKVKDAAMARALWQMPAVKADVGGQGVAALWPGMSVCMGLKDVHGLPVHTRALQQSVKVWLWQPADAARSSPHTIGIAFDLKHLLVTRTTTTLLHQLQVLPGRKFVGPTSYAAIIPFRFLTGESQAVAILITVTPWKKSPADAAIAESSRQRIAQARNMHLPRKQLDRPDLLVALYNLNQMGVRRASLVYLAGQCDAGLTQDVAAVANAPTLQALVRAEAAATIHASYLTVPQLGWVLDKTTFLLLYKMQKTKALSEQLRVALELHLGEAAWHVSSLDEIAGALRSRHDYRLRIIKENLIYLEDSSPAARLTAYNWLKSRGFAPGGYHPLAGNQARNAALDKAANDPVYLERIKK